MTVRPADSSDHPALLDIWLRSVRATHAFLTDADIQELLPAVRDAALPQLQLWVRESDGQPVGFLGLSGAHVEALFIAPDCCCWPAARAKSRTWRGFTTAT